MEDLERRGGGSGSYGDYLYQQSDEYKNEQKIKPFLESDDQEVYPTDPKTNSLLQKSINNKFLQHENFDQKDDYEVIVNDDSNGQRR